MNALWNAPISDRFSSLCARVFSPAAAILESEKTLGTRLGMTVRVLLLPRNARDTATRKLAFVSRKSPEKVFFFTQKVSRKFPVNVFMCFS